MKLRTASSLAIFTLAIAGCASTSRVMLGDPRPPIAPGQVRIYSQPPPHYREIALLETASGSFTYGEQNKMNSVLGKLRTAAAQLGANGVLLQETGNAYGGGGASIGIGGGSFGGRSHIGGGVGVDISPAQKHARAIAIWVDPAGEAPPR